MIVVMKPDAKRENIDYVLRRVRSLGLKDHVSSQEGQTLIGLLGDLRGIEASSLESLPGVERIEEPKQPYRLASREFRSAKTIVQIGDCQIGGEKLVMMGGPCSVESQQQIMTTAESVSASGAVFLRGGAFKPRSSPYSFAGLAEEGLQILAAAREKTGLLIVTEVMAPEQVELVCEYADLLQLGTRNMQNYALLHAVGESNKPVLLKRGMMSTIKEFLLSAEYILSHGNPDVVLCERGIRTFETTTRNSLDINAVPVLAEMTHLPIIVDPSHATGKSSLVESVSLAAVAAGADGLLVEVHPEPDRAWSDGYQSLTLEAFAEMMTKAKRVAQAVGRDL